MARSIGGVIGGMLALIILFVFLLLVAALGTVITGIVAALMVHFFAVSNLGATVFGIFFTLGVFSLLK